MNDVTRRGLLAGTAVGALAALTACTSRAEPLPQPSLSTSVPTTSAFLSGSSCIGAADGEFGRWRGRAIGTSATWVDDGGTIPLGDEFGDWTGSLDYSPQYRLESGTAFTWAAAARGAFDRRFRTDLAALKTAWGDREATVYYRFQHEFNGDWYPWAATEATKKQFVAGWRRFADLFHEVFEGDRRFQLSWCANGGTQSQAVADIRTLWPGDDYVDVVGVDYYDFFPIASRADWNAQQLKTDEGGGPIGIGAWHRFATEHGKPLALPEWGNQYGDNPLFIEVMHEFIDAHRVVSPTDASGNVLYEIYFNQVFDGGTPATKDDFRLQEDGADNPGRPKAAERYRALWGSWSAI